MYDYIRSPKDIYDASFKKVKQECDLSKLDLKYHNLVIRMIHGSANPDIIDDIHISKDPILGVERLFSDIEKPKILVDCEMVKAGIMKKRLPSNIEIICSLNESEVVEKAQRGGITRSMAQVDYWYKKGLLGGSVIIIGNAPTCLFRLLEVLSSEVENNKKTKQVNILPLAIFAFPIGYIGAAEAKEELIKFDLPLSYITLKGRLGGSAIAASAFNSILIDLQAD